MEITMRPRRKTRLKRNKRLGGLAARVFFTSGLSRKGHAIKARTAYDRRRLKRELRQEANGA
jgi:hypothetical protein